MGQSRLPARDKVYDLTLIVDNECIGSISFHLPRHFKGYNLAVAAESTAGLYFSLLANPTNETIWKLALDYLKDQDIVDALTSYGSTLTGEWQAVLDLTDHLPGAYGDDRLITFWNSSVQSEEVNTLAVSVDTYIGILKQLKVNL